MSLIGLVIFVAAMLIVFPVRIALFAIATIIATMNIGAECNAGRILAGFIYFWALIY